MIQSVREVMTSLCLAHSHPNNENRDQDKNMGHNSQDSAEQRTFSNATQTHLTSAEHSVVAFYADLNYVNVK